MKKILFVVLVCLIDSRTWAQNNLVINPSFEDTLHCPTAPGQIYYANNWRTLVSGGGDPDLHHSCAPSSCYCSVPEGFGGGYQYPKSGDAFAGIMTYYGVNGREYIQGVLLDTLNPNTTYCISLYVNLRNNSKYYCNSVGVYLDNGTVYASTSFGVAQAIPQVYNTIKMLNDTLSWIKIEGGYTASGTENHITIGNFFTDADSEVDTFTLSNSTSYAYYNIDDVSVVEIPDVYAGNDTTIYAGDSVFLGRKTGVVEAVYMWHSNGTITDSTVGLWVQPDSTTTYVLQQSICSNVSYDTVMVTVDFGSGISPLANEARIKLYPNPVVSHIRFSEYTNVGLYSITGQFMTEKENVNALDISTFSPGVYVLVFTDKKGGVIQRSRVVKQ